MTGPMTPQPGVGGAPQFGQATAMPPAGGAAPVAPKQKTPGGRIAVLIIGLVLFVLGCIVTLVGAVTMLGGSNSLATAEKNLAAEQKALAQTQAAQDSSRAELAKLVAPTKKVQDLVAEINRIGVQLAEREQAMTSAVADRNAGAYNASRAAANDLIKELNQRKSELAAALNDIENG